MKRNLKKLGVLLALLTLVAAGCGREEGGQRDPSEVGFDLRVGVVTSFTGDLSDFGRPIDEATKLAVALINESLGRIDAADRINVQIAATEDDQTQATAGVEAATKLVQTDDAQVIVGALGSAITTPIAESVTIPNEIVQISPASTSPALTELNDDGYFWRTVPSDAVQGRVLADAMAEAFGADATVNTGTRNDAYGTALTQQFTAAWEAGGGTIGRSVQWNPEAATLDSEAQELAGGEPDAWMIIDFPETWAKMGPALVRAGGWDPARTFTADGLRSSDLPGRVGDQATEGMRGTAPSVVEAPAQEAFDAIWNERVQGVERQTFDAQSFDGVMVAFLAAAAGGSADPAVISENLQAISGPGGTKYTFEELDDAIEAALAGEDIDYEGASGPIDFDENGDPSAAFYETWQYQGGELVTLETFGPITVEE